MPRKCVAPLLGLVQSDRASLEEAFYHRIRTGCTLREAAKRYNVKTPTLHDAFMRSKKVSDGRTFVSPRQNAHKVLSDEEENVLATYAIKIAKMFYGMSKEELKRLVYRYALACESKSIPRIWIKEEEASRSWCEAYMARHPHITLRRLKGICTGKATAFNSTTVNAFFDAYTEAMSEHQFTPDRIYNIDENIISAVMKPVEVDIQNGEPMGSQISLEQESTMTFVGIINAAGHFIPPVFMFPRKRSNDTFQKGTTTNDRSKNIFPKNGWMNEKCFLQTLQHLKAMTSCSMENKIMLIIDNAECHVSIHAIEYAIKNGIVIVILPPHTSSRLQPLEVTVFEPFRAHLDTLINDFLVTHPHTHITEHMLPKMAYKAWVKACTPANVLDGFKVTGIWPINRNIFSESDFESAEVLARLDAPVDSPKDPENPQPNISADKVRIDGTANRSPLFDNITYSKRKRKRDDMDNYEQGVGVGVADGEMIPKTDKIEDFASNNLSYFPTNRELLEQNNELRECVQEMVKKGKYSPEQVFVVEQTQVWWGCLPTNKDVIGHTLTILVCFNAKGECRLTPLVVGHQSRPQALKDTRMSCLPVVWRANRRARVTSTLFDDWFVNHFVPAAQEHCRTKCLPERGLLLVRSTSGRPHHTLDEGGFKVAYLPSNGPWPLHQGVGDTLSRHYLTLGVQSVAKPHSEINMWNLWKKVDIKLAIRNITLSWNLMSQETLNSAWSGIWPGIVQPSSHNPPQDIIHMIKNDDILEPDESVMEELVKRCQKELREHTSHVSKIAAAEVSLEDEGLDDVTAAPQVITPCTIEKILHHIAEACTLVKDKEGGQELCKQLKEASKEYSDLLLSMKDTMDTDHSNLYFIKTEEVETGEEFITEDFLY